MVFWVVTNNSDFIPLFFFPDDLSFSTEAYIKYPGEVVLLQTTMQAFPMVSLFKLLNAAIIITFCSSFVRSFVGISLNCAPTNNIQVGCNLGS